MLCYVSLGRTDLHFINALVKINGQ